MLPFIINGDGLGAGFPFHGGTKGFADETEGNKGACISNYWRYIQGDFFGKDSIKVASYLHKDDLKRRCVCIVKK